MKSDAQATLRQVQPPDPNQLMAEVERLREALYDAVRALGRRGVTPARLASLPDGGRGDRVWEEAARVWRAAGVHVHLPARAVLRCTDGAVEKEYEYPSPRHALEAAIAAIEINAGYPEAIEVDGRRIMDRASILRAWTNRHDPG